MSGIFGGRPKVQQPQAAAAITIQQSAYGTPVYLLYGTNRVYGNLIWYGAFSSTQISTGGSSGKGGVVGGGGKGGGSGEYNYSASFDIGLCEGPITAIGEVYVSKQVSTLAILNGQLFNGALGQAPPGYMTTSFPSQALGYTLLAHVMFPNFGLGTSSETPQFSFETFGLSIFGNGIQDASPDQVFIDFLTRCGLPSGYIDSFTSLAKYCQALGFFISPLFDQQRTAIDWLKEVMTTLNSEFVWYPSQGYLSAVPYGDTSATGNGATYVPNFSPIYSIGDDDYLRDHDQDDPVTCTRTDLSDVYNQAPIEYVNRSDQYNVETYQAFDDGLVDVYGFRTAPTLRAHHITSAPEAQQMAQLSLNRQIYVRNTYTFKLPWNYILLDPLDIIAINDSNLGLVNALVRVVSIDEDEKDGELTFTVEEIPAAIAGNTVNPNFLPTRSTPNYNQSPGNVNTPVFFEPPLAYTQKSAVILDMAISGSNPLWGGCQVWLSTDGDTYQYLSEFNGKTRMGVLTANLASFTPQLGGNNIDTSDTLGIDMTESAGVFNNAATDADAVAFNTLCYVDGELISFGNDALTAPNKYNLTYLNRGCYGSTISAHSTGANFFRIDDGVFTSNVNLSYVGKQLYFKFLSYNVWGGAIQSLDEVEAYTYTILGSALTGPLLNPTNLTVSYVDNVARLNWTGISDVRSPILYAVSKGSTFANSQVVGYTTSTDYLVYGTDTYWVTGVYQTPFNTTVYSASPVSVSVTTPSLQQNLIETYEEDPTWSGTCSMGAAVSGSNVVLEAGNILSQSNVLTISNIFTLSGALAVGGLYTAPSAHTITSNYVMNAKVILSWSLAAEYANSDVTAIPDIPSDTDITAAAPANTVLAQPQIRLSTNGGSTYGAWQNWTPGVYTFNAIQYQIYIYTLNAGVIAVLSKFGIEVDVPLLTQQGQVTTSTSADTAVSYTDQYNVAQTPQLTIVNQQAGDDVIMPGTPTTSGFSVSVYNAGARVVRTVQWSVQSY